MTEKYFINEDLFYINKSIYKIIEDNEIIINRRNWFNLLKDYGWTKLKLLWRNKLNSKFFALLECGSDGDCLFHVISEALNMELIYNYEVPKFGIKDIRELVSSEITETNFSIILESYKAEVECDEFFGDWDPNKINSIEELKNEIKTLGNNFWGDHILMQLLSTKLKINFIILDGETESASSMGDDLKYDKTMLIYYSENLHFQLIGYFNGCIIQTVFETKQIPIGLLNLYSLNTNK
jgi:hypothetical protein